MHFKNVYHWAHKLHKKILNMFKSWKTVHLFFIVLFLSVFARNYFCSPMTTIRLCRCWIAMFCMFYLIFMSISAFQSAQSQRTAATTSLCQVSIIFIVNLNIYDRRTNNHVRNALFLLRPFNNSVPSTGQWAPIHRQASHPQVRSFLVRISPLCRSAGPHFNTGRTQLFFTRGATLLSIGLA